MREFLAILAGLLATFSTVPYIIDIVRRKTRPNIVTWFTWTILTAVAGAADLVAHEPRSALLIFGSCACTAAVVIVGLKYGIAKYSLFDIACQLGALLGLVLWWVFNSPLIGLIVPVAIDFIAAMPTVRHSWLKPAEETWQTFMIGVIAPVLTIMSLTRYNTASLIYPVYLFFANGLIVAVVIWRRRQFGISLGRKALQESKQT